MTEQIPQYGTITPRTKAAFRKKPCCLLYSDPCYEPPDPEDVTALIDMAGWSQREVAQLAGVRWDSKGSTTVRRWKTSRAHAEHRDIPYSAWRLLLLYAGIVELDQAV